MANNNDFQLTKFEVYIVYGSYIGLFLALFFTAVFADYSEQNKTAKQDRILLEFIKEEKK